MKQSQTQRLGQAVEKYSVLSRLKRSKLAVTTIAWALASSEIVSYHEVDREYCRWVFLGACAVSCCYLFAQGRVDEAKSKNNDASQGA